MGGDTNAEKKEKKNVKKKKEEIITMGNKWLEHVKKVKSKNPKLAFKDVLKKAKESYKK